MTTEKQILGHRKASARDRSLKCIKCDEYKSSSQLIYCLDCNRVMCADHSEYDVKKKDELARMIPDGVIDVNPVFVRFGTCNECVEYLDGINFESHNEPEPEVFVFDTDFSDTSFCNSSEHEDFDALNFDFVDRDVGACNPYICCQACNRVFYFEHCANEFDWPTCAPLNSDALEWNPEIEGGTEDAVEV